MAVKTIYCAQAFWWREGQLLGGQVHQFLNAERASEGGEALFTGADGVAVFSVEGHPDIDLWEHPVMLRTFGDVPSADRDPWVDDAA